MASRKDLEPTTDPKDGSVTLPLAWPITVDGVEQKSLRIRRSKVKDEMAARKAAGGDDQAAALYLICGLTGLTEESAASIDSFDQRRIEAVISGFMEGGPKVTS